MPRFDKGQALLMMNDRLPVQRVRLFRYDWMERFTFVSPITFGVTWSMYLALVLYMTWGQANLPVSIALVLAGLVIWTLFEYGMHRFIFHMKPKSKLGQWLVHLTHGNHHVFASDAERNLMPPGFSIMIITSVWAVFLLLFGPIGSVVQLGFAAGYVIYDVTHYACHQLPLRGPLGRQVRRHHLRHHYARQEGNYAITAIFWDKIFGTALRDKPRENV